jgi:transposase InsO family protein
MIKEEALRRARVLAFWEKHGLEATMDAHGVKRSTLYLWRQRLEAGGGKFEALNPESKAPKNKRTRKTDYGIEDFIINQRREHPRISKDKLAVLLIEECLAWNIKAPSASTTGRIMEDLKKRDRLPLYQKFSVSGRTGRLITKNKGNTKPKNRRKGYIPEFPGDLIEIDAITEFICGIKRYIITAIDLKSDFAFAFSYSSLSSTSARDFMQKLEEVSPFEIQRVQTDNGQEFAKYFRTYLEEKSITHFHTYPRSPKMNAHIERLNRTIQEEFSNWHKQLWRLDINLFNHKLIEWLIWYNTKRPHWSLGLKSPMSYIVSTLIAQESNMLWTDTKN